VSASFWAGRASRPTAQTWWRRRAGASARWRWLPGPSASANPSSRPEETRQRLGPTLPPQQHAPVRASLREATRGSTRRGTGREGSLASVRRRSANDLQLAPARECDRQWSAFGRLPRTVREILRFAASYGMSTPRKLSMGPGHPCRCLVVAVLVVRWRRSASVGCSAKSGRGEHHLPIKNECPLLDAASALGDAAAQSMRTSGCTRWVCWQSVCSAVQYAFTGPPPRCRQLEVRRQSQCAWRQSDLRRPTQHTAAKALTDRP